MTTTPIPDGSPPTVAQIIEQYLADRQARVTAGLMTKAHLEQTARYLHIFAADFGDLRIDQCRRRDPERWLMRHPEFRSPHTKAKAVGFVVAAFRWAADEELLPRNPYSRPRDLPVCEPRAPITLAEVRRILLAAKQQGYRATSRAFRIAIWFMWQTGCRTSEMREVRWEHYDDERGVFELAGKTTKKTGRKRMIVLNAAAWRLIRWMRRRTYQPAGRVFLTSQGLPWDKDLFGRRFRHYADVAGVRQDVTAYSCRHGFCVERLVAGVGSRQIADLMGHSSTKFVDWYGRGTRSNVDYLRANLEQRRDGE